MNSPIRTIFSVALVILAPAGMLLAQTVHQPAPVPAQVPLSPEIREAELPVALESLRALHLIGRSSSTCVLVVPSTEMSMEDLGAVTEDMTVMGRILQTKLKETTSTRTSYDPYGGGTFFLGQDTRNLQCLYLQGYGALFTMEVDYPLTPGPETTDEAAKDETESDVDTVWRQTRMELFNPGDAQRRRASTEEAPKYSAEKVEALITGVVEALKHASNIRTLQPEEVVVVTITGRPAPFSSAVHMRDVTIVRSGTEVYRGDIPAGQFQTQAVMTIRAKLGDIKSYANGEIDLEQFRSRTQVLTYPKINSAGGTAR